MRLRGLVCWWGWGLINLQSNKLVTVAAPWWTSTLGKQSLSCAEFKLTSTPLVSEFHAWQSKRQASINFHQNSWFWFPLLLLPKRTNLCAAHQMKAMRQKFNFEKITLSFIVIPCLSFSLWTLSSSLNNKREYLSALQEKQLLVLTKMALSNFVHSVFRCGFSHTTKIWGKKRLFNLKI